MLISLKDLYLEYDERIIFNHIDFNIEDNDQIGIVGVNGSGKSSLLKNIAFYQDLDENQVMVKKGLKVSYLKQELETSDLDVISYVMDHQKDEVVLFEAQKILNQLKIFNHKAKLSEFSGGQQKRIALAKALVCKADLLLLDEPTNHLDYQMIEFLEKHLKSSKIALVIISHDRYFLDNIVTKIVEIEDGNLTTYQGNYDNYLELKALNLESASASHRKLASLLRKETKWIKQGPKARSTKSKHRIENYEVLKEIVKIV